ncbi:hypothetical protein FHT79_003475 [Rhizobium sp. BK212]|uniref:hypothetical protein n=1 Tax=Rhizobium sp. BK212 TaxID=2587074 RepID=UPI00160B2966|nr:hypothetical protein [Rhizobium sp. BK212]MBB4216288.1 hypothetical protein [Rhizobium sp. BK212]
MTNERSPGELYWEAHVGRSTAETLSLMEAAAIDILKREHARAEPDVHKFLFDDKKMEHFRYLIWGCFDRYINEKYRKSIKVKTNKFKTRNKFSRIISTLRALDDKDIKALNNEYIDKDPNFYKNRIISPLKDAENFFNTRARSRPGRRPHTELEIPLDVLMTALEYALGRKFRRNYKIAKGKNDFVHSDAKLLAVTLKKMDPGITTEMVKTVLKNYPARNPRNAKIPRTAR